MVLLVGLLLPAASAAEPTAAEISASRALFAKGVAAARRGDWSGAHDFFDRAHQLNPRPLILLNLAGAEMQIGKLVEAAESYRRFIRVAEGDERKHLENARQVLQRIQARIPTLNISVRNIEPNDEIRIDERSVSQAVIGVELPIDPGRHIIVVKRSNEVIASLDLVIAEGAEETATIHLKKTEEERNPTEEDPTEVATILPPPEPEPKTDEDSLLVSPLFWVVVGAIVIGSSVTIGVVATQTDDDYRGSTGVVLQALSFGP